MSAGRDYLIAVAVGVAAFVIWLFLIEGAVFMQTPPRLPLGVSVSLNAALLALLILRRRAHPRM